MRRPITVATTAAFTILLASLALRAQQPPAQPPMPPPAPPPAAASTAKSLVPVAASTLAANPDPYYGESVTLTGAVEKNLATLAFSVDQDKTKSTARRC